MLHTLILVHSWGPEQGFGGCFVDRLSLCTAAPSPKKKIGERAPSLIF